MEHSKKKKKWIKNATDGEHTLNLSFHFVWMEPSLPSICERLYWSQKVILLLPVLQKKKTEDVTQQIKLSAVEFWQHLRSTFSLYTDTYWCKLIMISFPFTAFTDFIFTSTDLIYTEIKCSRAEGGTGKHFSISQINHHHYKLPYR